ncbi:PH domain-containing protein [candidate division KSB1 bacterium]|nr:PH domain-containing protein [candidate division KSB1 bacterium]
MEIKPHKNLITKLWFVLLTVTFFIALFGLILQILIPLDPKVTAGEVATILWPIILGIIILMWVIAAPLVILWVKNLSYSLEEERITIKKGILTKVQQNIPYRAITDFLLNRSLYDRWLKIGAIRIQTAGQSRTPTGYEGQLSGLVDWDGLHQQLRAKIKKLHLVAESTTTADNISPATGDNKLDAILIELKAIRKVLESK